MRLIQQCIAALSLAGVCATASAAGNLVLDPASSSVAPGGAFSLTVMGTAFSDTVVGGGFNLSFNAAMLTLDSVVINTLLWEFAPITGTIDNAAGTLSNVAFNTFIHSPTGSFEAATLNFTAKAPGLSAVTLSESALFPFANTAAEVIAVSYGAAQVNAVPEPASVITMLLGLGLLPWALRRRA